MDAISWLLQQRTGVFFYLAEAFGGVLKFHGRVLVTRIPHSHISSTFCRWSMWICCCVALNLPP